MPATLTVSVVTKDGSTFQFDADDFLTSFPEGHASVIRAKETVAIFAPGQWVAVYFTAPEVVS